MSDESYNEAVGKHMGEAVAEFVDTLVMKGFSRAEALAMAREWIRSLAGGARA